MVVTLPPVTTEPSVEPTRGADGPGASPGLRALLVDDEAPTLSELAFLLGEDPRVGSIRTAASATEALRALDDTPVDVVFSDISMPGLDGMDLARVLARFADRPQVVFVTAYDGYAVDAFDLDATDYVMKPVRPERLAEAVRRVLDRQTEKSVPTVDSVDPTTGQGARLSTPQAPVPVPDEVIPVELAGVTTFVQRSHIIYAQAQGDYARLHTAKGSHLVRVSLNALEERWGDSGFVRIHRSTLVSTAQITAVTVQGGRCKVRLGEDIELEVSRRHTRALRDRLIRSANRPTGA